MPRGGSNRIVEPVNKSMGNEILRLDGELVCLGSPADDYSHGIIGEYPRVSQWNRASGIIAD